jgi:hypothetical protein
MREKGEKGERERERERDSLSVLQMEAHGSESNSQCLGDPELGSEQSRETNKWRRVGGQVSDLGCRHTFRVSCCSALAKAHGFVRRERSSVLRAVCAWGTDLGRKYSRLCYQSRILRCGMMTTQALLAAGLELGGLPKAGGAPLGPGLLPDCRPQL